MKNLRHLCAVIALTFMLALSAFAGQIETPFAPPTTTSTTTTGQIDLPGASTSTTTSSQSVAAPSVTETVLNLLQSVLSLF